MGAAKNPARIIDGPYAQWAATDEQCQMILQASGVHSVVRIGQAVYIDVTQLGPDASVPNNGEGTIIFAGAPAKNLIDNSGGAGEIVVDGQSANGGPCFGVVTNVIPQNGLTFSMAGCIPTYTNTSGTTLLVTLTVRQVGFAYVYVQANGSGSRPVVLVGSTLVKDTGNVVWARVGTATIGNSIGTVIANAIDTTQSNTIPAVSSLQAAAAAPIACAAPMGPGLVSIVPTSLVGLFPPAQVLIDSIGSGVQELVSVGAISYPAIKVALQNQHQGGFPITGPATNPTVGSTLISAVGANNIVFGLVAAWVNVFV